jgi:hypothetical protein
MENELNKPIFNPKQEQYVKDYFSRLDQQLGVTKDTSEYLANEFAKKLQRLSKRNSGFLYSGKGLIASIAGAFSLGIIFSQIALMPATMATRGYSAESSEAIIAPPHVISLRADTPKDYSFKVASLSLDADIEVSLINSGKKVEIILHSLRANVADQTELKSMLNLSSDASGDYTIIVSPKN